MSKAIDDNFSADVEKAIPIWTVDEKTAKVVRNAHQNEFAVILSAVAVWMIAVCAILFRMFAFSDIGFSMSSSYVSTGHLTGDEIRYVFNDNHYIKASNYGIDYTKYKDGALFNVYLDDDENPNANVVAVKPLDDINSKIATSSIWLGIVFVGGLFLVIICVFIARNTVGRPYTDFVAFYRIRSKTKRFSDKFYLGWADDMIAAGWDVRQITANGDLPEPPDGFDKNFKIVNR